jgi:hypothetical protein
MKWPISPQKRQSWLSDRVDDGFDDGFDDDDFFLKLPELPDLPSPFLADLPLPLTASS